MKGINLGLTEILTSYHDLLPVLPKYAFGYQITKPVTLNLLDFPFFALENVRPAPRTDQSLRKE